VGETGGGTTRSIFKLCGVMKNQNENSPDPRVHCAHIENQIDELIQHAQADIERVTESRFQALLSATADVLNGLKAAYQHYANKA
jgi:hypothetical protein